MKTALALLSLALVAGVALATMPVPTQPQVVTSIPGPQLMPAPQANTCGPDLGSCAAIAPDICDCDVPIFVGTCTDFNGRSWKIADCGHPVEYCDLGIYCIP